MITVKECRKILKENGYEGIEDMTDERILELRDFLYHLARIPTHNRNPRLCLENEATVLHPTAKEKRAQRYRPNHNPSQPRGSVEGGEEWGSGE